MRSTVQTQPALTQHIPDPLKTLILEYLSLEDHYNLSLCNRKLYSLIQNNSSLWARHLFKKFLDPLLRDQDLLSEEQPILIGPSIQEYDSIFQHMVKPKKILQDYYTIKNEWRRFLTKWIPTESQRFVNDVFGRIRVPQSPFPCLKRDIHHFPTNTMFQNFLTEVYFEVQMRGTNDRNSLIVEELIQNLKTSTNSYSDTHSQTSEKSFHRNSITLKYTLNRRRPKAWHRVSCRPEGNKNKDKLTRIIGSLPDRTPIEENRMGRFYKLVCSLTENYCKMTWSYLTGIKEPCSLLAEYTRLWKDFVMLIIDYNQIFFPLANALNDRRQDRACSIWNMMIEMWMNQVYSMLVDNANTAFCSMLNNYRCSQGMSKSDASIIGNNDALLRNNNDAQLEIVLKEFYQAICDLSFNEYTVFFWDCITFNAETPKRMLDAKILEGVQIFYTAYKPLSGYSSTLIKQMFEEDIMLVESLFGTEIKNKITKLQLSFMDTSLTSFFEATFEQARNHLPLTDSYMESHYYDELELQRVLGSLEGCHGHQAEIQDNRELGKIFSSLVRETFPSIYEYCRLMSHLREVDQYQMEKSERKKTKLIKAGHEEIYDRKVELYTERKASRTKTRCNRNNFPCIAVAEGNVFVA